MTDQDETPAFAEFEPTQAEVDAFTAAWEAERAAIGRGIAPKGQKTRAGLRAAFAERARAEGARRAPCTARVRQFMYRPDGAGVEWVTCTVLGDHEVHRAGGLAWMGRQA